MVLTTINSVILQSEDTNKGRVGKDRWDVDLNNTIRYRDTLNLGAFDPSTNTVKSYRK